MVKLAVLVGAKGRGSNLRAIVGACASGEVPAQVVRVVTPDSSSPAAQWALDSGIPAVEVRRTENYTSDLLRALQGIDIVCLAGYLYLLPPEVLAAHPGRVLNIHPALLPKFGGQGMYGLRVHEAVLASGDAESGCTVHLVTERYDEGEALVQLRCPVLPGDTPETLAARVLQLEHQAYPQAIRGLIERLGA